MNDRMKALASQLSAMTPEARAAMAQRMPVTTIEGHTLSVRNQCLCAMQAPNVTIVGGFRQWIAAGRCVRKGEKAIYVLRPCSRKSEDGETDAQFFVSYPIFDVSQTDAALATEQVTAIATAEPAARPASIPAQHNPQPGYYSEQFTPL